MNENISQNESLFWREIISISKANRLIAIKVQTWFFRTTPTEPVKFIFDESLVEESAGKLLPNQLTVDNLTVEWLRNKLTELEASIKENQEKRTSLTNGHNSDTLANGKTTPINEINNR